MMEARTKKNMKSATKQTFKKGDRVIFDGRKEIISAINGDRVICQNILDNGKTGKMRHLADVSQLKLDKQECGKPSSMGLYCCTFPKGHAGNHSWDVQQTDKATARPPFKNISNSRYIEFSSQEEKEKFVNQYDALNAVAEASQSDIDARLFANKSVQNTARKRLEKALADLAAIREGKV